MSNRFSHLSPDRQADYARLRSGGRYMESDAPPESTLWSQQQVTDEDRAAEDAAERRYWERHQCSHRGPAVEDVACRSCGGTRNLTSYSCTIHGTCTELRRAVDPEIRWCYECPDKD